MKEKDEKEQEIKEQDEEEQNEKELLNSVGRQILLDEIQQKLDKKEVLNRELIKCMIEIIHLNGNKYIPKYKINEKIKKKLLKYMPFRKFQKNKE